jgi:hypothetical protein
MKKHNASSKYIQQIRFLDAWVLLCLPHEFSLDVNAMNY